MPAKKKTQRARAGKSAKLAARQTLLQQCRQMPGRLRQACVDTAMARYDRHYHPEREHHLHHIVVDAILAALLLVSLLFSGFFLLSYRQAGLHEQIDFRLTPRQNQIVSGESLPVSVRVQNNTDHILNDAYVTLPEQSGYTITHAWPMQDDDGKITLGTLRPGEARMIEVEGEAVGPVGESIRVNAILRYRTNSFLNYEEKLVSEPVRFKDSDLQLTLDMPDALVPNEAFDFTLRYENVSSAHAFPLVRLVPFVPAGWEILESNPRPAEASLIWDLGTIGAQQSGMIRARAVVHDQAANSALLNFKLYSSPFGRPFLQTEAQKEVPVRHPHVSVALSRFGEIPALGGQIKQSLTLINNESFALQDVVAEFSVNLDLIDRDFLPNGAVISNGRVTMLLTPSLSAQTTFKHDLVWKLRERVNASAVFGTDPVQARVSGQVSYHESAGDFVLIPLQPVVAPLQSDAAVEAVARYYGGSGEQIGRGPLPPKVGETTKYWVFMHVTNQLNPLSVARVQARLPVGAEWTGRFTLTGGESLRYDRGSRQVIWDIGDVADYSTDYAGQTLSAGFEVAVTPTQQDLGKTIILLNDILLQAHDEGAGQVLSARASAVDTALTNDAYASDDGRVKLSYAARRAGSD